MKKSEPEDHKKNGGKYGRFALMILSAGLLMYLFTYLNTFAWNHIYYSEERVYMTLTMVAMMAVVMLSFMLPMYRNKWVNIGIYAGSALLFVLALWLMRSQQTVGDVNYMRGMIPHHSIAILTSERAQISDPRVRELADEIIAAQRREISMMKVLINDIREHGEPEPEKRDVESLRLEPKVPSPDPNEVEVPDGFRVEVVMEKLTYPTSVEFDEAGNMYVAEAGYSYGDSSVKPRIMQVSPAGNVRVVAGENSLTGPVNDLLWYNGQLYISHRGKISVLEGGGNVRDLVTGLPSLGDHHNNQLTAGPDGKIYFGQGTATNSGVVGPDNFKMGWLKLYPDFHDVPAQQITLTGKAFESINSLKISDERVETLPFHPFGEAGKNDLTVAGRTKASGTVLRMNPDGSGLEVYAWGLRNPYGLMWSPEGTLYATENGFDVRGSRPVANDKEDIYVIKQGAWYGWPDYAMGLPVTGTRFKPEKGPQPEFLMVNHPEVEQPWMNFPKHSAIAKIDFGSAEPFGKGQMFVAFFGHMSPMTGKAPDEHGGHRVVRIDPQTQQAETFFTKKHGHGEHGSEQEDHGEDHGQSGEKSMQHDKGSKPESFSAGPRRLLDVRFSPDGNALYIVDFGAMKIRAGAVPVPKTGVIWRLVHDDTQVSGPPPGMVPPM